MITKRFWWRLADVAPLAEHAISTPTVNAAFRYLRSHKAQTAGPALIWQQDARGEETLSSNGWPAWHSADGQPHKASALMWQHSRTGASGSYNHTKAFRDYILISAKRRDRAIPTVAQVIRAGIRHQHHWFCVDTRTWPFTCTTSDHRDDIVPAGARWVPAMVTARALSGLQYPAVIADGYTGADGVLPRFTRTIARQIAADLADLSASPDSMPGEYPQVRFGNDGAAIVSWQQHSLFDERLLEIDRCYPDAGGLYSLGAYQWTWDHARS